MELSKEELVFLKLFMFDAWFYCDVRNYSHDDRKLFHSIKRKLTQQARFITVEQNNQPYQ